MFLTPWVWVDLMTSEHASGLSAQLTSHSEDWRPHPLYLFILPELPIFRICSFAKVTLLLNMNHMVLFGLPRPF